MSQTQLGTHVDFNFTNSLRAVPDAGGSGTLLVAPQNYASITALDANLTAYDNLTYSAEVLNIMSTNDKVFALRNLEDWTTIADYVEQQVSRVP